MKPTISRSLLTVLSTSCLFAALLWGCGGGGGGGSTGSTSSTTTSTTDGGTPYATSVDSSSPTLDDGGHYVTVSLVANQSAPAEIDASSTAFDPIAVVEQIDPDGTSEVVAEDDDGGGGTNAKATFQAVAGTHYTVIVTSATGDPSGAALISYTKNVFSVDTSASSAKRPTKASK